MHFQGYEYKDIAEHLDLPIGTIKSRLHTARATLKKMISRQESLPSA
jgi:RNA polymerase sigma-70 factor (ECF subfamily)